jgi:hypothetical protein
MIFHGGVIFTVGYKILVRPRINHDEEKVLYKADIGGRSYKTFYDRNLRIGIISGSVCP